MHGSVGHSIYTKSVMDLVNIIQSTSPQKDSLFEQAEQFYLTHKEDKALITDLKIERDSLESKFKTAGKKDAESLLKKLNLAKRAYKEEETRQEDARLKRLQQVINICTKLIQLSEGSDWDKTQVNSAKILGTLQMLCPNDGLKVREEKQRFKPAYKAVVSMRLLDKLLADKQVNLQYLQARYVEAERYSDEGEGLTNFHLEIAIPFIIAAIFQDVGLLHPEAQKILKGEDGKRDEFALLEKEARIKLLKVNHQHTLEYIVHGLGVEHYVGDSKEARTEFKLKQEQRMKLLQALLVGALKPKLGIGNLIKVPQIYTSFVFSSKPQQSLHDLPKAGLVIANAAKQSAVSKVAADSLLAILGHFPQGFGITYIPRDADGKFADSYEYAIVIGLNPTNAFEPICRVATRNLGFIGNGQVKTIDVDCNLYYPEPKKMLEKIDPERLKLILKKLVSNFEERKDLDLIPSFWDPYGYFEYKDLQNLWKKA